MDDYDPDWSSQQTGSRLLFKFPIQQSGLKFGQRFQGPQHYFNQVLGNRSKFFSSLAQSCNLKEESSSPIPQLPKKWKSLWRFPCLCVT